MLTRDLFWPWPEEIDMIDGDICMPNRACRGARLGWIMGYQQREGDKVVHNVSRIREIAVSNIGACMYSGTN